MMMEKPAPTVTVVIPVFNGENFLAEAIESVLNQTFRDFEVLVVDDGSSDGTWAIVERYMAAYPTAVRGIRKENGGTATALNAGIRGAKGSYFAWLSHDDRFVPHKLEAQLDLLNKHPELVGVYSDYSYIDAKGNWFGRVYSVSYPPTQMLRHLLQSVFINGSTLLIERQCLQQMGLFDETLRYAHDAMMWLHLALHYQLGHIPEPLTEYRKHPAQATHTQKGVRRDTQMWLQRATEHFTLEQIFPELKGAQVTAADLAAAHIYLGDVLVRYLNANLSLKQYWQAWRVWPNPYNPAPVKAVLAIRKIAKQRFKQFRQREFSQTVPFQLSPQLVEINLRDGSELVKDIRFSFEN
jgi:glycosyltransferase involved in cell wall biosynthesis